MVKGARLNLGCGNRLARGPGVVNHDLRAHRREVDVAHDLNVLPWPWPDNRFGSIVAWAVLEHLRINLLQAMDECWRLLLPGGLIEVKLPFWDAQASWSDPTHYWKFAPGVFDQFDPATKRGKEYDFYTERKWEIIRPASKCSASAFYAVLGTRKPAEAGA